MQPTKISAHTKQFDELFSRNQDTDFKPKSKKLKKRVEKYNEKIIYWHFNWNSGSVNNEQTLCLTTRRRPPPRI